ncbi:MAG: tyrosine recombinase XerC [Bacteroidetes bacterium]|nr:tyrosine recombinase XerC [Bacteroidota bacterium]
MTPDRFFKYLEFEKRYSPNTIISYKKDLKQFGGYLEEVYNLNDLSSVQHLQVRSWIVSLINGGISPRSVNRKLSSLKSFYKFLKKQGVVNSNPMQKVQSPKTPKKLPVFVEQDSINFLLDKVPFNIDHDGLRSKLILELFYATGMRLSELINLKVVDVDLRNENVKVLGKGNKERIIPMSSLIVKNLKEYLVIRKKLFDCQASSPFFVTDKGKKLYPKLVYRLVNEFLSLVTTLEKKSPHVLRHTFATHLSNEGADLNAIKELLGHSSLAATQVYTHNTIDRLIEVHKQAHPKA